MNRREINYFRELLNAELELLLERAGTTLSTLLNDENNASEPLDLATIEITNSTLLRFRDRESRLIPKIVTVHSTIINFRKGSYHPRSILQEAGFQNIKINLKAHSRALVSGWFPGSGAENFVASADIVALKPL